MSTGFQTAAIEASASNISEQDERFAEVQALMNEINDIGRDKQMAQALGGNQELNDVVNSLKDLDVSNIVTADTVELANTIQAKSGGIELGQ